MKTKADIEADIDSCVNDIKMLEVPGKRSKKLRDKLIRLRQLRLYLESNPKEVYLMEQLQYCRKQLSEKSDPEHLEDQISDNKSKSDLKVQIKTLEYILVNEVKLK
jgi:ATP-dependent Lon protease